MRQALRDWSSWKGRSVHPLRLATELICAGWALAPLGVLLWVFLQRFTYPIDIEWMEGGSLYQAYRVLHAQPLYVSEVTGFAPYPYPPVHTVILALVGLVSLDFWSGRLVSMAFFTWMCVVLYREIYRQQARSSFGVVTGLLAVAVIVCGYPVLGQWYDLVRVDVVMMGLLVWGAARALKLQTAFHHALKTAIILVLAVFTKQTAGIFVAWICVFVLVNEPKCGLRLSALIALLGASVYLVLNWWTDGGFDHFVIANPGQHEIRPAVAVEGFQIVFQYAPFVAVVPFALLLVALRGWLTPKTAFWVGSLLLAVPTSIIPYAKVGAYLNALLPVVVLVGPATMLLIGDIARQPGITGAVARWSALAGFSAFIALRPLAPATYLPGPEKWRAANELNAIAASLPGGLVVRYLGFLPARSGHSNMHWQSMAVWDSIWRNEPMDEIACLEQSKARWVLLHSRDVGSFANYVRGHARLDRRIPDSARVRMVTGAAVEIDELWERTEMAK